jgi:hypothetical protein
LQLVKFAGHGGNDRLDPRSFDDTFLGGTGFDVAHVDGGVDTCRSVERRDGCDRGRSDDTHTTTRVDGPRHRQDSRVA